MTESGVDEWLFVYLHSNMVLLKFILKWSIPLGVVNLHSNMVLLKLRVD